MVNIPKIRNTYCKRICKRHTKHKVRQSKSGASRSYSQGKRKLWLLGDERKHPIRNGQSMPVFHKKSKTSKKLVLIMECSECGQKSQQTMKRTRMVEFGGTSKKERNVVPPRPSEPNRERLLGAWETWTFLFDQPVELPQN